MKQPSSTNILFIDDQKICHTVIELALMEHPSYKLLSAYSGREALDLLSKYYNQISVIISDIKMDDYSGNILFQKIQSNSHYKNIPFILQSGFVDASTQLEYPDGTPVPVIYKPYNQQDLFDLIESVTSSSIY
ncbi:MAG: response regulator [Rickettsiaceae bacterium]|nr:response regulator [Rickettsiaceae bacterium]